ncbi:replication initiation factor domain-containing protein [Lactobacillus equicursoris]|uniref:Replication initiation factor domain-containing protein n=1 Tax=Lactobacillus equicursoris TaxID=420645 RepID=A0A844FKT3_9LACO|nr:replication initiation factor domain-containing protein [Lactobacillus equicursoris]MST79016.1 replication initiation factor domain-containing protein [Lactobacillus equicursoris]
MKLLAEAEQLQLTIEKEAKTIEDMRDWVDRQISPTLSAILKAHGGDLAWLRSTIAEGSKRLSQKHKDAITQFLQKEGTLA